MTNRPLSNAEFKLPREIDRLEEIAHNLWWSWSPLAREVFRSISVTLWRRSEHNPVRMLREVTRDRLEKLAKDRSFLERYQALVTAFDQEMNRENTIISREYPNFNDSRVAYFSAEYGLHSSLPIYSGGLGVLSGDHCKTASDVGLALTAVGFMYPRGYFEQHINADGMQQANYERIATEHSAMEHAYLLSGEQTIVHLPLENPEDLLHLQVWLVRAGRVKMYLIDSDLDLNKPWNREISTRLYGGDQEYRLRQEIALGIGGVRALRQMEIDPDVWHANEGHVAFMLLERVREAVQQQGLSFGEACEFVKKTSVFTTHTPVPAGHDAFPFQLIERYFWHYWPELGVEKDQFFDLARHQEHWGEAFNMTVLSLNLSTYRNAVSKKHEIVTREMWPDHVSHGQNMIAVTNGVHVPTWISPEMSRVFETELGSDWRERQCDQAFWDRVLDIPNDKLWSARDQLKRGLITFMLSRIRSKWMKEGMETGLFIPSGALIDPSILTIGFARRFATYKRATLIFHDLERLKRLLNDPIRPIQLIFSGKAHPADEGGKRLIQQIYEIARDPAFAGRIAFIENYSMHVAKNLVRGVDLWMNTPKAPLEASGTSGMKAAINGVPNFSILDGWWLEGWNGKNGWGIEGATTGSVEEQDRHDATMMYDMLEQQIIPMYYDKGSDGIPHRWLEVMKESIRSVIPQFSSERMLREYISSIYTPAASARTTEATRESSLQHAQ